MRKFIILPTIIAATTANADVAELLRFEAVKINIQADEFEIQVANLEAAAEHHAIEAKRLETEATKRRAAKEQLRFQAATYRRKAEQE